MGELYIDKNDTQENIIKQFNIIDLFGKEALENIQQKISKATGLAFVTVDYKGDPITRMTSFTEFCHEIRKNSDDKCDCKASDAFGGIQSAVTHQKFVYFCPCGLLEIAIPIIVRGHYLGAFIGGQVRCVDAPEHINKLENVLINSKKLMNNENMQKLFMSAPLYKYERFVSVADLISLIINQLGEKEALRLVQNDSLKGKLSDLKEDNKKLKIENKLKEMELINLKADLNPYFLVNILNSISNLATIEDAEKTNEMIITFSAFLKQSICDYKSYKSLKDEFENVDAFLKMQKIKYGDMLEYSINFNEDMVQQMIPSHIVMPFVEYAVFYGIGIKNSKGKIQIDSYYDEDDVVIEITDDGMGLSEDKIKEKFKMYKGMYEGEYIQICINNARQKLITLFGKDYDTVIQNIENESSKSIIRYPRYFEEGNSKYV